MSYRFPLRSSLGCFALCHNTPLIICAIILMSMLFPLLKCFMHLSFFIPYHTLSRPLVIFYQLHKVEHLFSKLEFWIFRSNLHIWLLTTTLSTFHLLCNWNLWPFSLGPLWGEESFGSMCPAVLNCLPFQGHNFLLSMNIYWSFKDSAHFVLNILLSLAFLSLGTSSWWMKKF